MTTEEEDDDEETMVGWVVSYSATGDYYVTKKGTFTVYPSFVTALNGARSIEGKESLRLLNYDYPLTVKPYSFTKFKWGNK